MRRLILEVSEKELSKVGIEIPPFQKIKSLELLHLLRQDQEEFAAIWRVEFKDASSKIEDLLADGFLVEVQLLEKEKNGTYTVFMRGGPILSSVLSSVGVSAGYLFPPLGIRDGKLKISFLGSSRQVGDFLEKINAKGIRFKVVLLSDASFSPDSPLNRLTEKQREVLITAYKLGYYDIPRRINSDQLAEKLGIVNSTLVEHLRKAERRLLAQVLEQRNDFWYDEVHADKVK
jgi:DNA-binding MarR family transcriptional regulator